MHAIVWIRCQRTTECTGLHSLDAVLKHVTPWPSQVEAALPQEKVRTVKHSMCVLQAAQVAAVSLCSLCK